MGASSGTRCARCGVGLHVRVRGPLAAFIAESVCERCGHPAAAKARGVLHDGSTGCPAA